MVYKNETVTSISDLITKLDAWMSGTGMWTSDHLDTSTTAGTGGEWAMTHTGSTNIRFAASWDAENSGVALALYQYSDQAYVVADRPWGQDHDSGNGYGATTTDTLIKTSRHVLLAAAPLQYWAFEDDSYTHIVVQVSARQYVHFGFGILLKYGDWTGGEYCYGQLNSLLPYTSGYCAGDSISMLLDGHLNDASGEGYPSGTELFAATIHAEGLPNQTANGMWMVSMGGKTTASVQATFGSDRQSNDGASSDVARHMFIDGLRGGAPCENFSRHAKGTDISGFHAMWEIAPRYYDDSTGHVYGPMGRMPDVRGINMELWEAGDEIIQGGDTWVVFPAQIKWQSGESQTTGNLGIAYKKVTT